MNDNNSASPPYKEVNKGYVIKRSIVFENDRGFALGENPNAVQPFVTWQFTEEKGKRDYYWGHYSTDGEKSSKDYDTRVSEYRQRYRFNVKEPPKPIVVQMKEGAEQAAKDNVTQTHPKNTQKHDRG